MTEITTNSPRKCTHELKYSKKYDATYCPVCGEWREKRCKDADCEYCKDRPEKPGDV